MRKREPTEKELALLDDPRLLGLEVRQSSITNGGKGLFTTRKLAMHTLIGRYRGEEITREEAVRRYPDGRWPYVLSVGGGVYVDAADPEKSNHTRYIQSPHGTGKQANCRFESGCVVTVASVKPNSELFVGYGPNYFKK